MRNSIFKKYFLMITAVILISIFCLGAVLLLILSKDVRQNNKDYMTSLYEEYIETIKQKQLYNGSANLEEYSLNFLEKNKCEVILLDNLGKVVYYSKGITKDTPKYISTPVLNTITYNPEYFTNKISGFYDQEIHAITSLVKSQNEERCIIFTRQLESERISMMNVIRVFTLSLLIILVFVILIAYFITKSALKPIIKISEITGEYAKGDFTQRISVEDSNEFENMAQALNNMANSLEKSETIRNSFVANVSHELRTPMTSIGGFVDGILDGTIPEEEHRKYLRIVSDETKRLTKLVYSMLNMAKIEGSELKLNRTKFNMLSLVVACLSTFEKQIDNKGIEICGLDIDKVMVYADNDLIYQVVYNLIENAIKFVNSNGYIEFEFKTEDDVFMFKITNSGEGISKEELPLIFDKFYKTDKSRGLDKTGVGIGLYLSNSIIRLHEGKISVDSSEGVSTEFSFTIPQQ